ncbi:unnamed protein product, partial [Prorocentrum cordatum]
VTAPPRGPAPSRPPPRSRGGRPVPEQSGALSRPMAPSQLDKMPELGTKPVTLTVKLPPFKYQVNDHLGDGLRELYRRGELTDVSLMCAEQAFSAHKVVLAASSEVFKEGLAKVKEGLLAEGEGGSAGKREVRLADVYNPEAVKVMLDYIYQVEDSESGKFNPRTQDINKTYSRWRRILGCRASPRGPRTGSPRTCTQATSSSG